MKKKEKTNQENISEETSAEIQQQSAAVSDNEVVTCDCTTEPADGCEALQAQIDQLKKELEDAKNNYLRSIADFDNFRKRQREDVARQISWARENLLLQILGIADNLQRALASSESTKDPDTLFEGLNLILRQMQELLKKEGVEPIEAEDQEFDPEKHEAMMRDSSGDYPENMVIQEFEKGYTFDGRVIRPSKVKVSVES